MPRAVMIPTGTANMASVAGALGRLGVEVDATRDPSAAERAELLVLPGVGSFGEVATELRSAGLDEVLRRRIGEGRPTLAVCLGLQLLAEASEETPGAVGLGIVPGTVRRLPDGVRRPQLGWNTVQPSAECRLVGPGTAYYANSFALTGEPDGWASAVTTHGRRFVAALERGPVLACQFHPELSGTWGRTLLERWLATAVGQKTGGSGSAEQTAVARAEAFPRVVPCLDVAGDRVVKGVRFAGLRDAGEPAERAAAYAEQGADELVLLDVAATPESRGHGAEVVARVRRALSIPLTVGGGVRAGEDAAVLLDAGADKVAVNTAAVRRPELLAELANRFGSQCTVLALDAARVDGGWRVVVLSGRERLDLDAVDWARRAAELGAGEILLTSWDRDGTHDGYDTELIAAIRDAVQTPIVASGGASDASHMAEALRAGADAVLAASIFHDGETTVGSIKSELAELGVEVRR